MSHFLTQQFIQRQFIKGTGPDFFHSRRIRADLKLDADRCFLVHRTELAGTFGKIVSD